jgi:hypothetical protein
MCCAWMGVAYDFDGVKFFVVVLEYRASQKPSLMARLGEVPDGAQLVNKPAKWLQRLGYEPLRV